MSGFVKALCSITISGSAVASPVVGEDSLGEIPDGALQASRIVSPDLRRVAQIACVAAGCAVHENGFPGPSFETIIPRTLRYAGGKTLAYAGKRATETFLVVEGKEINLPTTLAPPSFSINPAVSNDGVKAMAVLLASSGKTVRALQVTTGAFQDLGPYEDVVQPQFGADGRAFFIGKRGPEMFVVMDGVEGTKYDTVGLVTLSTDGKRIAYQAKSNGVVRFIIDNVPSETLGVFTSPIVFSLNSKRFGYSTSANDSPTRYVLDGTSTFGPSGGGVISPFTFSADSQRVGYIVANSDNKLAYVIDGVTGPFFSQVSDLALWSSDTVKFAYRSESAGKLAIVFTGGKSPSYLPSNTPLALTWSADGRSFAHLASDGKGVGSRTVAIIDGRQVTPAGYSSIGPAVFSNEGHLCAHIARSKTGTFALIVGSKRVLQIDGLPVTPVIASAGGFAFIVARNGELRRVEWQPN